MPSLQECGIHTPYPPFSNPSIRPGAIVALVLSDGTSASEGLLLAKSARAEEYEGYKHWYTLPQEGKKKIDLNPLGTASRCLREEFGWVPPAECLSAAYDLGMFDNAIPPSRLQKKKKKDEENGITKRLHTVGFRTNTFEASLDRSEVSDYKIVRSWKEFDDAMAQVAHARSDKFLFTCEVVERMCRRGLLSWGL